MALIMAAGLFRPRASADQHGAALAAYCMEEAHNGRPKKCSCTAAQMQDTPFAVNHLKVF